MYKLTLMASSASQGESFDNHLNKLEEVLRRLCDAGLKVNAEKSTFCALEIEYLGYILSKNEIKPQSNKVQAILAIHPVLRVLVLWRRKIN